MSSSAHLAGTARPNRRVARLLVGALRPGLAGDLARLRGSEVELARRMPRPTLVVVVGVTGGAGASTLAALLGQSLAGLAPGRVAALDGDGVNQMLRARLGTDESGGLRQMLSAPQAWRARRRIDQYLARDGRLPLLAAAAAERGWPIRPAELEAALGLLRRRYPVVVVDLPAHTGAAGFEWAVRVADHTVVVGPAEVVSLDRIRQRLSGADTGATVMVPGRGAAATRAVRVARSAGVRLLPADPALARAGTVRPAGLRLATLAAVEEVVCRTTRTWRNQT
ncbi:MAG TPA: cellulose synthase operon protein YhjQ/BcsQ [Mycobacteriales bacterium]|nr:cellulose synthase operon protein YhjQ/BcsQ [Mycobacteriales bacterium]